MRPFIATVTAEASNQHLHLPFAVYRKAQIAQKRGISGLSTLLFKYMLIQYTDANYVSDILGKFSNQSILTKSVEKCTKRCKYFYHFFLITELINCFV